MAKILEDSVALHRKQIVPLIQRDSFGAIFSFFLSTRTYTRWLATNYQITSHT